jgi:hypothetical protein
MAPLFRRYAEVLRTAGPACRVAEVACWAAFMSRSTSATVRYSRNRSSPFGGRTGTDRGLPQRSCADIDEFSPSADEPTGSCMFSGQYVHGLTPLWPEKLATLAARGT